MGCLRDVMVPYFFCPFRLEGWLSQGTSPPALHRSNPDLVAELPRSLGINGGLQPPRIWMRILPQDPAPPLELELALHIHLPPLPISIGDTLLGNTKALHSAYLEIHIQLEGGSKVGNILIYDQRHRIN